MKTPSERGEFGAWLVEQRKALGDRRGVKVLQRDVVAELAAMGYPIEESYYRALEGGSKRPGQLLRRACSNGATDRIARHTRAGAGHPGADRGPQ